VSLTALVLLALAQLPQSADLKPVPIAGTVVDGSGYPVAFADVWLAEATSPDEGRRFGIELWWSPTTRPDEGSTPVSDHISADAAGRFTFRVPAYAVARRSPLPLAVWAASAGKEARLGWQRLPRIVLAGDPPVRVVLGAPARTELTILSPDGKPVAGARVTPIRAGELPIRKRLTDSLETTTDANGRAVIAGLAPEVLGAVRVEAPGFGEQEIDVPASLHVQLAPVGRVAGKLVAPGHEPIQGVTVHATTLVGGYAGSGHRGSAMVSCDAQGRFEISAIATGVLTLELHFDPVKSLPLRGEAPKHLIAKAGRATEVTIPLRETIEVFGHIQARKTDQPIAGVKVVLNGRLGGDRFAVTDVAGKYSGRIVREMTQPFGWPVRIPAPFFEPVDMTLPRQTMPLRGVHAFELTKMKLAHGVDVQGTVVGEDNKPVADAEVEAIWTGAEEQAWSALSRTDRTGMFTLHGVDPIADLNISAWDGFASTPEVTVRPDARPITLTISPKNTTPVGGRVVDTAGQPITGASVRLWRQLRNKAGRVIGVDPITAGDGSVALRTDADGRYRTRRRFPAHSSYYAEASAPGRLAAQSPAIALAEPSTRPPVLVLRRVGTVEGRVVNRQGQPVAGARIRQSGDGPMPTEILTADDGRFRLPGVLEEPALLFCEKAGYRPALVGCSVSAGSGEPPAVEVALGRTSEPPTVAYHTLPSVLPIEEEQALARRLIEPLAAKILARGDDEQKYLFLRDAAAIDPHSTIEWLDGAKFGDADFADEVRSALAEAIADESLDEATAIIEAATSANTRAYGYVSLIDVTPNLAPERKRAFLDQAILHSKGVTPLLHRFNVTGQIADRLIGLGDVERARTLLREGQELARTIPRGDKAAEHAPLYLTETLAQLDLPAALKIVEEQRQDARKTEPGDRSRIFEQKYGRIAYKLAARSPAVAERILLEHTSLRPDMDREIVAVCTKMGPQDLARARRLAETRISPDGLALRPYAFGQMAQAIAATDRTAAVRLLDEAFVDLERLAAQHLETGQPSPLTVATGLLPAVEQVAPDRLPEFLGRALLLRRPRGDETAPDEPQLARSTAVLAMMVARYDRGLVARLIEPELDRTGVRQSIFGADYVSPDILTALALLDPKRAVEQVEALPDDPAPGTDPDATKNRSRISVAKMLALHGADRWRYLYQDFFYLWAPDEPRR
jgi:protocatechuate 3,4-dioxygenase beta subunit